MLEEKIEKVKQEIRKEIGDLEDKVTALRCLLECVDDITSVEQAELAFRESGAWYYYDLTDFRTLMELAENYEDIKAGTY